MAVVDSHFHIWDPSTGDHSWLDQVPFPALRRAYSIDEYAAITAANGIAGGVLVQVLNDLNESLEFLAIAASNEVVLGVVGWVDLEAPDVADTLAQLRDAPGGDLLVGIRHLVQDEADREYLDRNSVRRGLAAVADAGLVFDLLVSESQLASALRCVRNVEHLRAVLDHGGNPQISSGARGSWDSLISELAATGRVSCKLSGFVTQSGEAWASDQLRPFLERVIEIFGVDKAMFGSDWPVLNAVADFDRVLQLTASVADRLTRDERDEIMAGTATRVYGLSSLGVIDAANDRRP
jgi:L-fucono-1,5-lactonase